MQNQQNFLPFITSITQEQALFSVTLVAYLGTYKIKIIYHHYTCNPVLQTVEDHIVKLLYCHQRRCPFKKFMYESIKGTMPSAIASRHIQKTLWVASFAHLSYIKGVLRYLSSISVTTSKLSKSMHLYKIGTLI